MTLVHSGQEASVPTAPVAGGNTDLPTPKYRIGDTLWYAGVSSETAKLDCPDCAGTKVWLVKTANDVIETPCQRCCGGYMSRGCHDKLDLSYQIYVPKPGSFVVGRIEASTEGWRNGDKLPEVMYWQTNGSGRNETDIYGDEASAMAKSQIMADAKNAEVQAAPAVLEQRHVGSLKIDDALYDEFKNGLWRSWYRYRSLLEKITETIEGVDDDTPLTPQQLKDLEEAIKWERGYYADQAHPMDDLVKAVHAALYTDGSLDKVEIAFKALPDALQKPFVKPVERDWSLDWSLPTPPAETVPPGTQPRSGVVRPNQTGDDQ